MEGWVDVMSVLEQAKSPHFIVEQTWVVEGATGT